MKNAKELALLAARALSDKKGKEIQVLEEPVAITK